VIVLKAFKYKFCPTDEQAEQLARTFGCSRYVYNQALDYRSKAWRQEKKSLGYHDTALKLTEWKKEPEKAFLSEVSSVVLQQSLRNLETAFTNFFESRNCVRLVDIYWMNCRYQFVSGAVQLVVGAMTETSMRRKISNWQVNTC
jgi:transposase